MPSESSLDCPSCRFRFNYRWTPAASMNAVRLGAARSFCCPRCHKRQTFDILHQGHDPAAPTFDDSLRASDLALVLGPVVVAVPLDIALGLLAEPRLLLLVPIGAAIAWLAVVSAYRFTRGEIPPGPPGTA